MPEPIMWGGDDPYTHLLCVGPTRCGKTATILTPMAYQLLLQKKAGKQVGFSLIEPKGDLVREVKEFCDAMEIPYVYIDPESDDTQRFNVMEGNTNDVAEATVAVLQSLFGKQEAFFQTIQELSTRNVTKLLKELQGDDLDLIDLLETLRSESLLEQKVKELKRKDPNSDLIPFFENELLGGLKDQYRKLVIGLRAQLENVTSNEKLKRIISGKSDINLDEHLKNGGVLLVNTSLGTLKKAGDAFGQFVIMHLQSATFRRKGTERTRMPHFLICDEYSRYINPDVEIFLSIAASYRVAGVFATQSLGQLEVESGKISGRAMKQAILTSCRNKIAFGGLSAQDAKEFADEFGKDKIIMRQSTYKNRILLPKIFPESYRDTESEEYRFSPTYLQDSMKRFHFICRVLNNGTPQKPFEGIGQFIPRDWKDRREWEQKESKNMKFSNQRIKGFLTFKKTKQEDPEEQMNQQEEQLRHQEKMLQQQEIAATAEQEAKLLLSELIDFDDADEDKKNNNWRNTIQPFNDRNTSIDESSEAVPKDPVLDTDMYEAIHEINEILDNIVDKKKSDLVELTIASTTANEQKKEFLLTDSFEADFKTVKTEKKTSIKKAVTPAKYKYNQDDFF